MIIESSNVRKKKKSPIGRKELSYVMLELYNVKMEPSKMRKKKVREPLNVKK